MVDNPTYHCWTLVMSYWRHNFLTCWVHHCCHSSSCKHRMIQWCSLQFFHHRVLCLLQLRNIVNGAIDLRHNLNALVWSMINILHMRIYIWWNRNRVSSFCPTANFTWSLLFEWGFCNSYLLAGLFKEVIRLTLWVRGSRWRTRSQPCVWVLEGCLWSTLVVVIIKSGINFLDNIHV